MAGMTNASVHFFVADCVVGKWGSVMSRRNWCPLVGDLHRIVLGISRTLVTLDAEPGSTTDTLCWPSSTCFSCDKSTRDLAWLIGFRGLWSGR